MILTAGANNPDNVYFNPAIGELPGASCYLHVSSTNYRDPDTDPINCEWFAFIAVGLSAWSGTYQEDEPDLTVRQHSLTVLFNGVGADILGPDLRFTPVAWDA